MELVEMALFTSFFNFVKKTTGLNYSITPMVAANVNLKLQLDPVSTVWLGTMYWVIV